MRQISHFIVKYRKFIILGVLIIMALSLVCLNFVNLNYDITAYLPEGSDTYDGMKYMRENFGMEGDAIFAVKGVDEAQAKEVVTLLASQEGVRQVIWSNTMVESLKSSLSGGLGSLFGQAMEGQLQDVQAKLDAVFHPEEDTYLFMIQLSINSSTLKAMKILNVFSDMCEAKNYQYAMGGSTAITKDIFDTVLSELWKYIIAAAVLIIFILLITSQSLIEPLIILLSLGIAVVVNVGTNIILNNVGIGVSIYTFAISIILQLGLTMDYSIFLIHAYREERMKTDYSALAAERAIPRTFSTILASALTTVGGFLTLCIMQFTLGTDIGLVLSKGVIMSVLSVLLVQPGLIVLMDKLIKKTTHKNILPSFHKVGKFAVKGRLILFIIAIILIIPALYGNINASYTYMQINKQEGEPTQSQAYVDKLSNSLVLILPVSDAKTHKALYKEILALQGKTALDEDGNPVLDENDDLMKVGDISIIGLYAMLPNGIEYSTVKAYAKTNPEMQQMLKSYVSKDNTTTISVMINNPTESPQSFYAIREIKALVNKYFPDDDCYVTGMIQAVGDLADLTQKDFKWVTVASMLVILVILIFSLTSFKESLLLVLIIELGVLINIALSYFTGTSLNFMGYLIITAVQLGATVDYAVLLAKKFKDNVKVMSTKNAAIKATADSAIPIITSVAILSSVCFAVNLITKNAIIGEMAFLIARGSIVSGILCILVLPGSLVLTRNWFRRMKNRNPLDKTRLAIKRENSMSRMGTMILAKWEENVRYEDDNATYDNLMEKVDPILLRKHKDKVASEFKVETSLSEQETMDLDGLERDALIEADSEAENQRKQALLDEEQELTAEHIDNEEQAKTVKEEASNNADKDGE